MKKLCTLLSLLFFLTPLTAQELNLLEKHAPQTVAFAQPFSIEYVFSHTPGYQVELDKDSLSADFEVQQAALVPNSPGTAAYGFTVIPFTLGKSTFTAAFVLSKDGTTTSARVEDPIYINVSRAKTFNDKNLREIRPPQIPLGWLTWLLAALAALAFLGVLYAWRKKMREKALSLRQEPEDLRPSDEIALSKIDALLNSGLWEQQQYKLFYITLSDILREYLWRQFHIDASADTSAELLRRVKNMPAMAPLLYALRNFLNSGDLVKFAKAVPEEAVRNKDVQLLRQIIRETSPKETLPQKEESL